VCGLVLAVLLAGCVALAWPDDSPVAAQAGGATEGRGELAWWFLVLGAAALAVYVAALVLLRARPAAAWLPVAAVAVAVQASTLAAPLLLSTDAWTYWSYGRIAAVHDANPYHEAPESLPDDPATRWVGADWRDATSVYGPAFTLASEPLAAAAGRSSNAAAWIYKALAALTVLGAAVLAALLSRRPAFACAFVGWSPVLALHFGGGGHNDAWMAILLVGALVLGAVGRERLEGVGWALAAAVKWIPLVLLPLRLLAARRGPRLHVLGGFVMAAVVVAAAATVRYGTGWMEAAAPIARTAARETSYAVPHRLEQLGLPHAAALALPAIGFLVVYVALLRRARLGRARLGLAAGSLLLATPYLAPWYLVWAAPLAAAEDDGGAQLLVLALSAYLLPQTIPT
jgi:hypothetical protein